MGGRIVGSNAHAIASPNSVIQECPFAVSILSRPSRARWGAAALALALLCGGCERLGEIVGPNGVTGEPGRASIQEGGWAAPVKLPVSDGGWEDSAYLTRSGNQVLFFYHPAPDILNDPEAALRIQPDGRIYVSSRPFTSKSLHSVSRPDFTSEGGPYISAGGVLFYHRTFAPAPTPNRIVRDGEILELGTPGHESNPHYCDAQDELYFDDDVSDIWVYKHGSATRLPPPINGSTVDYQPFLTDDCQTLYFTSSRGAAGGSLPQQIYRATRAGEFAWNEPVLVIAHPDGAGEFSMSRAGDKMVFVELTRVPGGGFRTDMYYSSR